MAKIKYGDVEEYCNEMHLIANRMKERLENVEAASKTITNGDLWTGEASDFYISKLKKLSSNFDDVFRELETSILFMAKCSDGYESIDSKITQEICENLNITDANLSKSNIFSGFNN